MGGSQTVETQVLVDGIPEGGNASPWEDAERLQRWLSILGERFRFLEQISSTRASWVWQGKDLRSGRAVAIKLLKDTGRASRNAFVAESLLLSELEHPGIVRYIAHGDFAEGGAYLVTEWLTGEDLSGHLKRGRLPLTSALTLLVRAANVLAAAHMRGIVHLDLKPSNLFLVDGDLTNIRLLDFGIARLIRSASSDPDEGTIAGTPGYMAPEQVLGEAVSPATDVFAMGCLAYRCLTGQPIFEGDGFQVMIQTVSEPAGLPSAHVPDLHPAIDALCASMLQLEADARPPDATAILSAIAALPEEILRGLAPSARDLLAPRGLTAAERVPITVVLVRQPSAAAGAPATAVGDYQASSYFEALADGVRIALPRGNATALDQALHAARLTLEVRAHSPDAAIVVAAGRGVEGGRTTQLHEVVAEAEALLNKARPGEILLDESSAAVVADRFSLLRGEERGVLLMGDKPSAPTSARIGPAPTFCIGREDELTRMIEIAEDALGTPRSLPVLLTGPAGIGKSHLFREFLERLGRRGKRPRIWSAYGDPMGANSSFRLVISLLKSAAQRLAPSPLASAATAGSSRPEQVPAAPFADRALAQLLRAGATDPSAAGAAEAGSLDDIHKAFADVLARELDAGPLLLRLEDIHWADLGSLRAVDYALSVLVDRPLLVVATARPEARELYPDLWHRRSVTEIRLRELDERDAEQLVSMQLGPDVAAAARAKIVQKARGNAFLLQELIRAQVEGRTDETPETALGVVQSRLRAFDPDARRVLRAASVFGQSFTVEGLTRLLGEGTTSDLERWLEVLTTREVVRPRDEGGEGKGYVFTHALVRDAAYDMLIDADRKLGQQLAAEWLEGSGGAHPVVTAQHYQLAGDRAAAGRCYLRATVESFEFGDFTATVRAAEQALALELSQFDRGQVQAFASQAYRLIGDVEAARRLSAEALRLLPPNTPLWRQAARTAMAAGASFARHRDS
ncbi:MAG: protein kinase [Myxococcales bacterium]|nr:protein kinase [Myxococcales bacterium]